MNYYPSNFYPNYPQYGNNAYQQFSQIAQQVSPQINQSALVGLQGKIVDGEEMVKATEVPLGGYGIFPKADLSEVYVKTWNSNGSTNITKYQPIENEAITQENKEDSNITLLLEKIEGLENKIDDILNKQQHSTANENKVEKRKELNANAY